MVKRNDIFEITIEDMLFPNKGVGYKMCIRDSYYTPIYEKLT